MSDLCYRVGGETRRQNGLDLGEDLSCSAEFRAWLFLKALHQGADQLKAQHHQDEEYSHDFASTALGQPALEPGEDRLHQDEVEQREGEHHQQRPGKKKRPGDAGAEKNSEQCQTAKSTGWVAEAVGKSDQKERTVVEREAQQVARVWIVGEGGSHHGENLPEEKDRPEQGCEILGLVLRDEIPGESGGGGEAPESAEGEGCGDDDARNQLHFAALGAQTIDEHAPA